jgi:hypothetical protein
MMWCKGGDEDDKSRISLFMQSEFVFPLSTETIWSAEKQPISLFILSKSVGKRDVKEAW